MPSEQEPSPAVASWTGDSHATANELRRVANAFGPGFRIVQLLRDAADEIDTLSEYITTPTPAAVNADKAVAAVETALREVEAMCGRMQADAANLSTIPDEQRGIHNAAWNLSVGVRAMITALKANGDAS